MTGTMRNALIALAAALLPVSAASAQAPDAAPAPAYVDFVRGDLAAPIEIIEYASFSCPHCGYFHAEVWPMLESEFVEPGHARFILRPIVTQPIQIAAASAMLASCAGDERYYDAVDLLFYEQENIFSTIREGGDVLAIYNQIAGAVGLTPDQFMACLNMPEHNARIAQTIEMANADGVTGTPSFLVNGRMLKVEQVDGEIIPTLDGEAVILNGERLTGDLDADNFRRIVLHFLNESDSGN